MNRFAWVLGLVCVFGCGDDDGPPPGTEGARCDIASDCNVGLVCRDGRCARIPDGGFDGGTDAMSCPPSRTCGELCCDEGTICGGTLCCAPAELCGGVCCGDDQACVADTCVLDCAAEETPCGDICCTGEDLCYLGACTTPGAVCESTRDCDEGEYCETTVGRCLPRAMGGEECEYMPDVGEFTLAEKWSWPPAGGISAYTNHNQIMMAPMVANLTDDDGDGTIDQNDVPDLVFHTFTGIRYWGDQHLDNIGGVLRIVSGADGAPIFPTTSTVPNPIGTTPGGEVAIADVDPASPGPEIMACSSSNSGSRAPGHLMILAANGSLLRRFNTAPNEVPCGFDAPAVGDMDGDGVPEIVVRYVIAHADGTVVRRIRDLRGASYPYIALSDVDMDGDLELVGGDGVYEYDGSATWLRDGTDGRPAVGGGYVAVADLDLDGDPEVVHVGGGHFITALDGATGDTVWGPIDVNPPELAADVSANGNPNGGGPPTIANFDDDPEPEIAFAGGFAYVIFEHDGSRKWYYVTTDRSSRSTGSSIFDFEGDGVAEVLYNDERTFRVFRGPDGSIFHQQCNLSGTLREYPIVVDVDNDDHAEIVLMENNYAFGGLCLDGSRASTGIHVFGHPENQWVRTRRIWNQHSYHVTNINEDGTVPARETPNWTVDRLNNFRQNVQPDGLFDAPDLQLVDLQASQRPCPTRLQLSVRVINRGRSGAPAGVPVTFYETTGGMRTRLGRVVTTRPLLPGESEIVEAPFTIAPERGGEVFQFVAVLNDPTDEPLAGVNECREDNNDAGPIDASCPLVE